MHFPTEILLCIAGCLEDILDVYPLYDANSYHKAILGPRVHRAYNGVLLAAKYGDEEMFRHCLKARPELRRRFAAYSDRFHEDGKECKTPLAMTTAHCHLGMVTIIADAGLLAGHKWALAFAFKNRDWPVLEKLMSYDKIRAGFCLWQGIDTVQDVIEAGDMATLEILLRMPSIDDAFRAHQKDRKPLIIAARDNNITALRLMLAKPYVDVNARRSFDRTALAVVVANDNLETVKLLLDVADVDVNVGSPVPLVAVMRHSQELTSLMMKHGAEVYRSGYDGMTALHEACQNGDMDMVKTCLAIEPSLRKYVQYREADSGRLELDSWTLISIAAGHGHLDIVKLLLDLGADPNEAYYWSAFHAALGSVDDKFYPEIVEFLLPRLNDECLHGIEGSETMLPLLSVAAQSDAPDFQRLVRALIDRGADVNCINWGKPVLVEACERGLDGIAEILIGSGADLDIEYDNLTCLAFIEEKGSAHLIRVAKKARYG